jgi:Transposase DDE domain
MQTTASPQTDEFPALLARLPADLDLDPLAIEHKAIQRGRKIRSGTALLRLALARGPGGMSLRDAAGWAGMLGLGTLTNPAVKYRLDKAVNFLKAVMEHLLAAKSASQGLHWPGRTIRLADGTCISRPGSKGTDWRVHGVFDLGSGGFSNLELTDAKGAESLTRGAPVTSEVRIADRFYGRAKAWHRFLHDSGGKADLIVRMKWNGFHLTSKDAAAFDLIDHLKALPDDQLPHEIEVRATVSHAVTVPIRLIILRKTPETAEATRKTLRTQASRKQKTLDPKSLIAAEFLVLATSLPIEGYPAEEVLAAYRLRWQIELAFKRLKSLIHIDALPARTDLGARSWLYPHLILALLCDDLSQDFLESFPCGTCLTPTTCRRCGPRRKWHGGRWSMPFSARSQYRRSCGRPCNSTNHSQTHRGNENLMSYTREGHYFSAYGVAPAQ